MFVKDKNMGKKIICLNLAIIPSGWDINKTLEIAEHYGYLFYDSALVKNSSGFGDTPYMIDPDEVMDKVLVDVSTEEGKKTLEFYNIKYKDDFKE